MTSVPEHNNRLDLINEIFLERSGKIKENLGEMTREELTDYCKFLLVELDKIDNSLEELVNKVNLAQGYERIHTAL